MIEWDEESREWKHASGPWTFDNINDFTGFAMGDPFESEEEVWNYFLSFNEEHPGLYDTPLPEWALVQMAREVIAHRWHMLSS